MYILDLVEEDVKKNNSEGLATVEQIDAYLKAQGIKNHISP